MTEPINRGEYCRPVPQKIALSSATRWYVRCVIAGGFAVIFASAVELYYVPPPSGWLVLAALTLLTGSFTVKIPKLSARISVSDAFVFTGVLLFGPPVATVIVASDCLIASMWLRPENRSPYRSLFNLSSVALSIWISAQTFYIVIDASPGEVLPLPALLWPLFLLAALYFLLNTWLLAFALSFERRASAVRLWLDNFPWLGLNYFGGVSVAALLVSYTRSIDLTAVGIILPLLVISYLTYRTSTARVEEAERHVDQVQDLYMSTIETLAMAVDAKDQITHGHIRRVQVYAIELAKRLGVTDDRQLKAIAAAALLHDMGKLAIPEHILNKPGRLTTAEFDRMKQHAGLGADLLSSIRFPYPVVPIVRYHHENWNGTGYPSGIGGTDIPLGARILSVVDCFDALTSDRPYRPRLDVEDAFQILRERRGTMYDPLVVDTFVSAYAEIAPAAAIAGQEARSIFSEAMSGTSDSEGLIALTHIRSNASDTTLLVTCSNDVGNAASINEALGIAAQCLRQLTPATVFALYHYDAEADSLICQQTVGDPHRLLQHLKIRVGERVTGWCAANRRAAMNSDASLDLAHIARHFDPPLRSTFSIPLSHQDKLVAVLTAYSAKEATFDERHRYVFEHVASALLHRLTSRRWSIPASDTVISFPTQRT